MTTFLFSSLPLCETVSPSFKKHLNWSKVWSVNALSRGDLPIAN